MVLGFLFGILLSLITLMICVNIYDNCYSTRSEVRCIVISAVVILTVSVGGITIGWYTERECTHKEIESYLISKETIEHSIPSNELSGFERIELVTRAVELNQWLAKKQYIAKQWYGVTIPDEILDIQPILLGVD